MKKNILFLVISMMVASCTSRVPGQAELPDDYFDQVEEWKESRIESLTATTGWLRLAGMYWLNEGENSFGSSDEVDVRFPEGTIPGFAGTFILNADGTVRMTIAEGVDVTFEDEPVSDMIVYDGEEAHNLEYGTLEWLVIVRDDLTAIRLYNKENKKADAFNGFPAYDVDPQWNREARYIPYPDGTTIPIVNVLGQQVDGTSPGRVEFTLNGTLYSLDALEGNNRMFIILGDLSNRDETYQAGRYMYIDYPEDGSELTVIDFNKAYNPPCAYSLYTTCQLPPIQNRLDVAIKAGEKRPVDWQGL